MGKIEKNVPKGKDGHSQQIKGGVAGKVYKFHSPFSCSSVTDILLLVFEDTAGPDNMIGGGNFIYLPWSTLGKEESLRN